MQNNNFTAINLFNGGVNTDLDEHSITKNQCEYLLNGEILDFKGNIGLVTNKNGNKYEFSISDGFVAFAYEVIKGVAFILSRNDNGQGEIGCYPAPNAYIDLDVNGVDYSRQYSPLWNFCPANDQYTTQVRDYLRTTSFNFQIGTTPSVRCRVDYDQSVNIYFCDGVNTDKVINTGFDINTGKIVENRLYGENSFPNFVEIINESSYHPKITNPNIISGGKLKNGNWKIFVRYTSLDYNPTSYLSESNMFMVSDINLSDAIGVTGEFAGHVTNKSIKFRCELLDPAYKFIEIAFIHYFGDTYEVGVVDKRYEINPLTNICEVLFTGSESIANVDLSQVIVKKTKLKISESITALDGRLFRGGLKATYQLHDDMAAFALLITGEEKYTGMNHKPFYENGSVGSYGMYKNWTNVYDLVGYWSCEAYPFAAVFIFNDGSESEAYPITGTDYYNNTTGLPGIAYNNNSGVIRFPDHYHRDEPIFSSLSQASYAMGIKFDVTDANTFYQTSLFLQDNVKGFYIVRGERRKNIIYQGFLTDTYTATIDKDTALNYFINTGMQFYDSGFGGADNHTYVGTDSHMPMIVAQGGPIRNLVPQIMYFCRDVQSTGWGLLYNADMVAYGATNSSFATSIVTTSKNRKALFSADYSFLKSLPKQSYYMQFVGKIEDVNTLADQIALFREIPNSYFFQKDTYKIPTDILIANPLELLSIDCTPQTEWNSIPLNGFVSLFNEGSPTDPTSFASADASFSILLAFEKEAASILSLAIGANSYIGMKTSFTGAHEISNNSYKYRNAIVNMFIDNLSNINISNIYDSKNIYYQKVTPFIPIETEELFNIYYNGDCFLQRVCQRVIQNPGKYPTSLKIDKLTSSLISTFTINREETNYITFGQIIEYVSEQNLNHGMRLVDGNKKFYPSTGNTFTASLVQPYTDYAVNNVLPESSNFNRSFSVIESLIQYKGFNTDLPEHIVEFNNRIMGSNPHVLNGFKDGYRQFALATYADYNFSYGRITDIQTLLGQLVCIMEHHVGLIPVNERATIGSSSGELLIGIGNLLPLKQQELSQKVGCQQKSTIVNSGNAIYGWDWQLRKIWQATTTTGIQYISDTRGVGKWLNGLIDGLTEGYSDTTRKGFPKVISSGWDQKYGDIYWSIKQGDVLETICYSEKINLFKGWFSFITPFYMTINEDFYSLNEDVKEEFWLHDDLDPLNKTNFYGNQYSFKLTFLVNERPELQKVFNNLIISSNGEEFLRLDYETLTQISSHFPFIKTLPIDKWVDPKYKSDKWYLPINRTETSKTIANNRNLANSKIKGNWVRISIEFNQNKAIFIKSILTEYNISNQ